MFFLKYDAEFRRFGLNRHSMAKFEEFYQLIERLHGLNGIQFIICYTDKDGDLLPINNDNNLARVLSVTPGLLRLIIQRKGECYPLSSYGDHSTSMSYSNSTNGNTSYRATNLISQIKNFKDLSTTLNHHHSKSPFYISYPEDFRPVSAIIDVDILPDTYRRVRLHKHKSSKPLGFYIRDGRSLRVTPQGVEQVPGIFISRLMPGGLAESTGLLSVNDEVIEVNGIEVQGKTLDQVTDMMVANSSNLIITVKPTNQRYNLNRSTNSSSMHNASTLSMNKKITSSSFNSSLASNGNMRSSIKTNKSTNLNALNAIKSTLTPTTTNSTKQISQSSVSNKPNESINSSSQSSSSYSSTKQANFKNASAQSKTSSSNNNKQIQSDSDDDDDDDEEILDQHNENTKHNDMVMSTGSAVNNTTTTNNNNNHKSSVEHSPNNHDSSSDHDTSDDKILTL